MSCIINWYPFTSCIKFRYVRWVVRTDTLILLCIWWVIYHHHKGRKMCICINFRFSRSHVGSQLAKSSKRCSKLHMKPSPQNRLCLGSASDTAGLGAYDASRSPPLDMGYLFPFPSTPLTRVSISLSSATLLSTPSAVGVKTPAFQISRQRLRRLTFTPDSNLHLVNPAPAPVSL